VGAVLAESAKIVAEDTAKAYFIERLPTKSGALKTTWEKSLEAKEILDQINEENAARAARVNRRILKLRDWVDSW